MSHVMNKIFAVILLAILLALPMGLWIFYKNVQTTAAQNNPKIIAYLTAETSMQQAQDLQQKLSQRSEVGHASYISPLQGVQELVQQLGLGDLLAKLPFNPLPAVIEMTLSNSVTSAQQAEQFTQELKAMPQVSSVQMNRAVAQQHYAYLELWHKIVMFMLPTLFFAVFIALSQWLQLLKQQSALSLGSLLVRSFLFVGISFLLAIGLTAIFFANLQTSLLLWLGHPIIFGDSLFFLVSLLLLAGVSVGSVAVNRSKFF